MTRSSMEYVQGIYGFDAVVQRAEPSDWDTSSPCEGWVARDVLNHVIRTMQMVVLPLRGVPTAVPATGSPSEFELPAYDGYVMSPAVGDPQLLVSDDEDARTKWVRRRDEIVELLDDPAALQRTVLTHWGEKTPDELIPVSTADIVVHTWDLSRAVDQVPVVDDRLAGLGLDALRELGTQYPIHRPRLLGESVEAPSTEAPSTEPLHKLLAFTGRDPDWTRAGE